jgi:hypothetical protein
VTDLGRGARSDHCGVLRLLILCSWQLAHGDHRVSIPLSILRRSLFERAADDQHMTLGGLALVVGTGRRRHGGNREHKPQPVHGQRDTRFDGAQQIAVPAFVSTLSICIVFVPMLFSGVARYSSCPCRAVRQAMRFEFCRESAPPWQRSKWSAGEVKGVEDE